MKISKIFAAVSLVAILAGASGCSASPKPTTKPLSASVDLSTSTSTLPGPKKSIQLQLVNAMKSACPDLSDFTSDPANWAIISDESAGAPYRMAVDGGDGGNIVVWFTPNGGTAKISIDEEYWDETNALLYYSGCETIAENPETEVAVPDDSTTVSVEMFTVPDFVGSSQESVKRWFGMNSAALHVTPQFRYGFNPKVSCEVSGEGPVISQSPRAGSEIENAYSSRIVMEVDCEW